MPASKTRSRKTKKGKVAATKKPSALKITLQASLGIALVTGAILGFSAPGFDQWYLAWIGLVPWLLLTVSAAGLRDAFLRGLVFGFGYNLIYLNWYLHLHPLGWLGFNDIESGLIATAAWMIVAGHQALIVGLVSLIVRALPLSGGFFPRKVEDKWKLPALLVVPPLWVIIQNKIANAPDLLGVPWPMVEYSQYANPSILQAASIIGGIGLGAVILLFNCAVAQLIATFSARLGLKNLASATRSSAVAQFLVVGLLVAALVAYGFSRLTQQTAGAGESLSVIQGNINIEMQKRKHSYTLPELMAHYRTLLEKAPSGICVWTESALPTYLKEENDMLSALAELSRNGKREMIIGSLDKDFDGKPYNSAFGLASDGRLDSAVYHKRYLVPFGEYMPQFVKYLPEWIQKLTSTPAGIGFNSGKFPVILHLRGHSIAPLICFETISPELCVSSVRNGGELLVNLSDLAWFHESMIGDQMVAFSVMRAVETGRWFVFAANTGPSAIIDPQGRIVSRSQTGAEQLLTNKVMFREEMTPFTQWFH